MEEKKVAILQSNYIPWKGYFDMINMVDEFIIYDEVQYTKNDWRNRNRIKTSNGVIWLTIPVRQENLSQKINETCVFEKNWNVKHWRTIHQAFAKSEYFKNYKDALEDTYLNINTHYLSEINLKLITLINSFLGIKTEITSSEDYGLIEGKTERLVDLVLKAKGTEYLSGPAAKDYLDENLFNQANIKVSWMNYSGYPEYNQLFPPFDHAVSVLDLIFNLGPSAKNFMKSFSHA